MDKNLPDIENLFRKALEDNEEDPSQNAWDGIEKKLDIDNVVSIKKKYDLLKKVALLLLFLLSGLSIYVWKNQDKNPVTSYVDISTNKKLKTKNDSLAVEAGKVGLQQTAASLSINTRDTLKQIKSKFTGNSQKRDDSFSFEKGNNRNHSAKDSHKIIDKTILEGHNDRSKKSLISITSNNFPITSIKKNKSKFNKSDEVVEIKIPEQIKDKNRDVVSLSDNKFGNNLSATEIVNLKIVGKIEKNAIGGFDTKESQHNIALLKINLKIKTDKTIMRKPSMKPMDQSRFALTAFYSHDIAFHQFVNSDPRNPGSNNFDIPGSENHASTLGALVDYSIGKHWGLQSGITLARSEFELEYEKPEILYAQHDNSGSIKYKLASPLGDAFVKPSFSNNPNIGDSIFSKSTAYNLLYLGIPLALKYNFNKGKFTLNALGGVSANFLTRGHLTTELEYGNDHDAETTDKIYGLKPLYFSGMAGVGIDYNIYKKFYVAFSPVYRFALNSVNNNLTIQSYPNSLSLGLGLKMKL